MQACISWHGALATQTQWTNQLMGLPGNAGSVQRQGPYVGASSRVLVLGRPAGLLSEGGMLPKAVRVFGKQGKGWERSSPSRVCHTGRGPDVNPQKPRLENKTARHGDVRL